MLILGPVLIAGSVALASMPLPRPAMAARMELGAGLCLLAGCVLTGAALQSL